ncbi:putative zinc-finger of transcription factor IIIC complex [Carpediemonas membranifera]|uniref:Putative zinc-finger of transcription factor IIIC complex n=1 Tax=Carpediemonas membranifera TaxID=201153 RepID=A0A8J6B5D2_9EUKA|nr:putative zinc-finger of transcription factor IIIC complex [Carpediemonas membranifera]|eukprot:KAG9393212.1 putative zinc-finger of transcription factor IIIC complex [Carpediemonas membranifera]
MMLAGSNFGNIYACRLPTLDHPCSVAVPASMAPIFELVGCGDDFIRRLMDIQVHVDSAENMKWAPGFAFLSTCMAPNRIYQPTRGVFALPTSLCALPTFVVHAITGLLYTVTIQSDHMTTRLISESAGQWDEGHTMPRKLQSLFQPMRRRVTVARKERAPGGVLMTGLTMDGRVSVSMLALVDGNTKPTPVEVPEEVQELDLVDLWAVSEFIVGRSRDAIHFIDTGRGDLPQLTVVKSHAIKRAPTPAIAAAVETDAAIGVAWAVHDRVHYVLLDAGLEVHSGIAQTPMEVVGIAQYPYRPMLVVSLIDGQSGAVSFSGPPEYCKILESDTEVHDGVNGGFLGQLNLTLPLPDGVHALSCRIYENTVASGAMDVTQVTTTRLDPTCASVEGQRCAILCSDIPADAEAMAASCRAAVEALDAGSYGTVEELVAAVNGAVQRVRALYPHIAVRADALGDFSQFEAEMMALGNAAVFLAQSAPYLKDVKPWRELAPPPVDTCPICAAPVTDDDVGPSCANHHRLKRCTVTGVLSIHVHRQCGVCGMAACDAALTRCPLCDVYLT